jgi:hypothetical protein
VRLSWSAGGYRLRLCPPTSADLLALGEAADEAERGAAAGLLRQRRRWWP